MYDSSLVHLYARGGSNLTAEERLIPTDDQKTTLYIIAGFIVGIAILWHVPVLKYIIYPFKLLTVELHEFSHAFAGCITCAKIESIEIDPEEGGATRMRGGNPYCTLPAGYLGSSFIGAVLVFCSFNILASKIASIFLGLCLLMTLYWARNWLTRGVTFVFLALIVVLWWAAKGVGLKYFAMFIGVMSCLYSLWDIVDDLVFRKVNESDASKFGKLANNCIPWPQCWGVIWFFISFTFLAAAVIAGLVTFKEDVQTQLNDSARLGGNW